MNNSNNNNKNIRSSNLSTRTVRKLTVELRIFILIVDMSDSLEERDTVGEYSSASIALKSNRKQPLPEITVTPNLHSAIPAERILARRQRRQEHQRIVESGEAPEERAAKDKAAVNETNRSLSPSPHCIRVCVRVWVCVCVSLGKFFNYCCHQCVRVCVIHLMALCFDFCSWQRLP